MDGEDENGGNIGEMAGTKPRGITSIGSDDVIVACVEHTYTQQTADTHRHTPTHLVAHKIMSTMAAAAAASVVAVLRNFSQDPLPAVFVAVGGLVFLNFALGVSYVNVND